VIKTKYETGKDPRLTTRKSEYIPTPIVDKEAEKKNNIVDSIISEGAQLSLLGLLVWQIGEKIGLDTPEFTYAKEVYTKIREELARGK